MARKIDPNDLSAGDVLRLVAPTIALIALLILVGKFAPHFIWLLIVLLVIGFYVTVSKLPQKDLAAMEEKEREIQGKIESLPVVGPIAKSAWRIFSWIGFIIGALFLILIVFESVKNLL